MKISTTWSTLTWLLMKLEGLAKNEFGYQFNNTFALIRISPIGSSLARLCTKDVILSNGLLIRKGQGIIIPIVGK